MTSSNYPGHDNPQLALTEPDLPASREVCDFCGEPIDPRLQRWELTTGRAPRTERHAIAHSTFDADTDGEGPCYTQIRHAWTSFAADAGQITRDPATGHRTLQGEQLHCGTPLQILLGAGTWIDGTYEILDGARGPIPAVAVTLGGLNRPAGMLTIPPGALLRPLQPRRR